MYTLDQKLEIVKYWYETKSYVTVHRMFAKTYEFRRGREPTKLRIQRTVHHFEKEKTLMNGNKGRSGRESIVSPEKKVEVRQSVVNSPKKSHRKSAQDGGS